MANPFDVFDTETTTAAPAVKASGVNPFDQFDAETAPEIAQAPQQQQPSRADRIEKLRQERGDEFVDNMLAQFEGGGPVDLNDTDETRKAKALTATLGVANAASRFSNSATLGVPKRIISAGQEAADVFTGNDVDRHAELRGSLEETRQKFPKSSLAADVGGAVVGLGKAAQAGVTATRFVPQAATGAKKLAGTTAALAADGAVIAGADALIDGRDASKAAGIGGAAGAAFNVITRGAGKAITPLLSKVKPATTRAELKRLRHIAYKRVENFGVKYAAPAVASLKQGIADDLVNPVVGLDRATHPVTSRIVETIKKSNGEMNFVALNNLRKRAARVASNPTGGEDAYAASILARNIDEFIESAPPTLSNGANGKDVANALKDANGLHRRVKGSDTISEAVEKANRRAASSGSGANVENATRQNIRQILDNPKRVKFFTAAEKTAMEKIVRGSKGHNLLRLLGKAAPTGTVSTVLSGSAGASLGGPLGAAAFLGTGSAARKLSEKLTQKNVDDLIFLIRNGAAPARTPTAASKTVSSNENQDAAARAALAATVGSNS